ncbi:serine/threonine protein kinase [Pararobbsia silviterrae]|uniref:Protein kinase n=1 Tax=Pararobbsia silviterrae TaxID=1792498 RepID=A0A494XYY6_9BURK|nr:serine/threonine protein kinase [Pararobbsia silviterrae]RKP53344.1 protein kinase [Pararobbsia silviterrae]
MASLALVIHNFRSGGLTHDEFFEQIDSTLSADGVNSARLLETLKDEQSRMPLPPDLYAELRRRIELLSASNAPSGVEETRVLAADTAVPPAVAPSGRNADTPALAELDSTKGIGDTLNNRFVLEACLGVGGMGTVYKALDLRKLEASDRRPHVAIKVLNLQFRGNPKSLIALQREARKAQTLAHRNIVTVYDFDRDGPVVFLTMEYLQGKPLSRVLRAQGFKGMTLAEALPIVRGMGHALAYAHERGFVHCDFKPANVFLTDAGEVKVIDFGIARVFQRPEQETDATVFDPGSLGALTPAYASPEMLEHLEPDPRDDVYALGCITYEMLTGTHPFDRLSATQARNAHYKLRRPESLGARPWRALKGALAFDRELRTPSVARFVADMGAQPREPSRPGMLAKSAIGFVVLSICAFAAYWYRGVSTGRMDEPSAVAQLPANPAPEISTSKALNTVPSVPAAPASTVPPQAVASAAALTRSPTPPTVSLASATVRTAAATASPASVPQAVTNVNSTNALASLASSSVAVTSPAASASMAAMAPAGASALGMAAIAPPGSATLSAASAVMPSVVATPAPNPQAAALSLAAVTPVLAQVPCSALSANVHEHTVEVRGFAPANYSAAKISDMLRSVNGATTREVHVEPVANDTCTVMQTLSPYLSANWQDGHAAVVHPREHNGHLNAGDALVVDVTTPGYDTYVNVDYFQLDGSVVHLVPSLREKDNQAPPHFAATVGSEGSWIISKPFGSELIVLTTTPEPVFDTLRPPSESRADYLAALAPRLKQLAGKYGTDKVDVDIAQINTRAAHR